MSANGQPRPRRPPRPRGPARVAVVATTGRCRQIFPRGWAARQRPDQNHVAALFPARPPSPRHAPGCASTADDLNAGVTGETGVMTHKLGRSVIMDFTFDIARNAAVALGDHRHVRGRQHVTHRMQQFGRADTAIRTDKVGTETDRLAHEIRGKHPHHGCAAVSKVMQAATVSPQERPASMAA